MESSTIRLGAPPARTRRSRRAARPAGEERGRERRHRQGAGASARGSLAGQGSAGAARSNPVRRRHGAARLPPQQLLPSRCPSTRPATKRERGYVQLSPRPLPARDAAEGALDRLAPHRDGCPRTPTSATGRHRRRRHGPSSSTRASPTRPPSPPLAARRLQRAARRDRALVRAAPGRPGGQRGLAHAPRRTDGPGRRPVDTTAPGSSRRTSSASTQPGIGRPTPGAHRDGVDMVAVVLLDRAGIKGGDPRLRRRGPERPALHDAERGTALLLDDERTVHETIDPAVDRPCGSPRHPRRDLAPRRFQDPRKPRRSDDRPEGEEGRPDPARSPLRSSGGSTCPS